MTRLRQGRRHSFTRFTGLLTLIAILGGVLALGGCAPKLTSDAAVKAVDKAIADYIKTNKIDARLTIFDIIPTVRDDKVYVCGVVQDKATRTALGAAVRKAGGSRVVDELRVLPDSSIGTASFGIVNVPVVNLGDGPGSALGDHMVTQAILGDVVELYEKTSGWYRVRMRDRYLGWIDGKCLTLGDKAAVDAFQAGGQAVITAKFATIRATASAAAPSLLAQDAVQGTVLPLYDENEGWTSVRLPDGRTGWLESGSTRRVSGLSAAFPVGDATAIINTAKQYTGLAYLWGGTTGYGFDCSGFTQFCYRYNGRFIPRDGDMQYNWSEAIPVERKDLKPGDLIFFTTYKPGPSHVGIYIGDNRYIHSGSAGLNINSFDPTAPDYRKDLDQKYFGARRFIK